MGAVIWSLLFGVYYYFRIPLPNQPDSDQNWIKAICLVAASAIIPNLTAAWLILDLRPAFSHVSAVMVGSVLFTIADYLLIVNLRHKVEHHRLRGSFIEGLLMADVPMVVGGLVLLVYLGAHSGSQVNHEMEAFAGGAVSFQLIASNVVFVMSQGGFIRLAWEKQFPKYNGKVTLEESALHRNPWAGIALMCGLVGLIVAVSRRFAGSGSTWFCCVGIAVLSMATIMGLVGWIRAKGLSGAGRGPVQGALGLSGLGLLCLMLLGPPCGMFSAERLMKLPDPDSGPRVTSVALSPDGRKLARGSDSSDPEQTVKVINTETGKSDSDLPFKNSGEVLSLAFSSDGKVLATGGRDLKVMLWDAGTGKLLRILRDKRLNSEHESANDVLCLAFSPDGRLLTAGGGDGTIYLWATQDEADDQGEPKNTLRHEGTVRALAFSADGQWLAAGGGAGTVSLWSIKREWLVADGEDKRELQEIKTGTPLHLGGFGARVVFSIAVSQDGKTVAAGFNDGSVRLWDRTEHTTWYRPKEMVHGGRPVLALLFSDDALILAGASERPGVVLWDTRSGRTMGTLAAAESATVIAFSRDGRVVASGSLDGGTLNVWQPE